MRLFLFTITLSFSLCSFATSLVRTVELTSVENGSTLMIMTPMINMVEKDNLTSKASISLNGKRTLVKESVEEVLAKLSHLCFIELSSSQTNYSLYVVLTKVSKVERQGVSSGSLVALENEDVLVKESVEKVKELIRKSCSEKK